MAKFTNDEIKTLIQGKLEALEERKSTWTKYFDIYEGKSWWSQSLPTYKSTEVDNQVFPLVQSLTGYLQRVSIIDRIMPPSQSEQDRKVASLYEGFLEDAWWFNRRRVRLQTWFRDSLIKGIVYGFVRVDQKADFPFIVDAFGPESLIKSSNKIDSLQNQAWLTRILTAKKWYLTELKKDDKDFLDKLNLKFSNNNDDVNIWDFWSKENRQNVLMTSDGWVINKRQDWPYKKLNLYPFFELPDISVLGSSEPISTVQMLYALQKIYDQQRSQIKENAEYMGNPPIVVDVESGIDTKKLEGKPRLIIRKYRDGEFRIVPVPPLPGYVERQPEITRQSMERNAAWSDMMQMGQAKGQRERGAISLLMGSAFTALDPKLKNLEQALNDANQILIGLLQEFSYAAKKALKFRSAQAYGEFSPSDITGKFLSNVEIRGLEPERERLRTMEIATFYKLGVFGKRKALVELGEKNPDAVMAELEEEHKKILEFEKEKAEYLERQAATKAPAALAAPAAPAESGAPLKEEMKEEEEEKSESSEETKVDEKMSETRRYPKYIDFLGNLLMPGLRIRLNKLKFKGRVRILKPDQDTIVAKSATILAIDPIDRAEIVSAVPEAAGKIIFTDQNNKSNSKVKENNSQEQKKEALEVKEKKDEPKKKAAFVSTSLLLAQIKKGILKSSLIKEKNLEKYQGFPGMYLVEPHSAMIYTRQKKLILKGRAYPNFLDRDVLLLGDKAYGIIRLIYGGFLSEKDINRFEKLHRVTIKERKKWWGRRPLYVYAFQIKRFAEPLAYKKPAGLQTYLKKVELILPGKVVKEKQAVPVTGDLKVAEVVPLKSYPVAKPEKKAFTTAEVYSVKRLKEILPKGHRWDISEKMDGIRAQASLKGDTVRFLSDEARDINLERIQPLVDEIKKIFPYDVVLDGELLLYLNGRLTLHQGVHGYLHGHWKPKPEELSGLVYKVFDILYVKNQDISKKPYEARSKVLDLFIKKGKQVVRAKHLIGSIEELSSLAKQVMSKEGVIVRALDASYFHTALMYKVKKFYDVDVKVIGVETTKTGAWVYHCALRDGTYMGQSYAQKYVKAKIGDVIRMSVEHITLRPSGRLSWYAPAPVNLKARYKKAPAGKESLVSTHIGRSDTLAQIKEIFLAQGGKVERWNKWLPAFKKWKAEEMPKLIAKIKKG